MEATAETTYPAALRRDDRNRGRLDGEQGLPSLAEVRRRHQELAGTGEPVVVGYQVVLLAELNERLDELYVAFVRLGRATALELDRCDELIDRARRDADRARERLDAANAPLTAEELRPRNPQEQRWAEAMLRHRREVARSRRIRRAEAELEQAREAVERRRADRAEVLRRHREAAAGPGAEARRTAELYQRRIAEYLSALSQHHPHGMTLYPLLTLPPVQLPGWVTETPPDPADSGSPT
ncbi:hypothetical protein [Actinoplanes siamensis]|uniref:Uncharacterized protein n=1 Tax=Actinoplanes siamensis TaxID=1223317 RepID=A0A919N9S8_9ACTN|nr:hypothetical protein [Actinoplanes siamensis]GIF06860.1 hypothetical protein Asi03nite_43980 [Actinoplanes siamensis]